MSVPVVSKAFFSIPLTPSLWLQSVLLLYLFRFVLGDIVSAFILADHIKWWLLLVDLCPVDSDQQPQEVIVSF